jgi:hypothetical protein
MVKVWGIHTSTSTPSLFSQKRATTSRWPDTVLVTTINSLRSHASVLSWYVLSSHGSSDSYHRDHVIRKHKRTIDAHGLFVLTVYPKKGGNIQVAIKVSESLVGETPVKTHPLSLARALSAMEDGKEACFISDKVGCITQKIDVLFWRVRHYISQKISPNLHMKAVG